MSGDQKFKVNLLDLPEDVLIIILSMLNSFDKYKTYCTCTKLKYIVCTSAVSKSQCFSLSPFASSEYLKCDFIKDVSMYIQELNLCAVQNLSKSILVPCLRRMPNLKLLNVCYTNIVIPDLLDVITKCPLKTISINFKIYTKDDKMKIPHKLLEQCQEIFKNVENVHFVGLIENLFFSTLPIVLLQKATYLKNLKFTVLKKFASVAYENECVDSKQLIRFTKFSLHFGEWRYKEQLKIDFPLSPLFQFLESNLNIQFVIVDMMNLFVSSGLINYFNNNFTNTVYELKMCSRLSDYVLHDNAMVIIWNSNDIILNTLFFEKVMKEIKSFIPNTIFCRKNKKVTIRNYNKYYHVNYFTDVGQSVTTSNEKRKRIAPPSIILDFNDLLDEHCNVKFALNFVGPPVEVKLSSEIGFLKKIALLHLNGFVKYGCEFFNILFKHCNNLTTFIVTNFKSPSCLINLIKNLPQAQALKNFMFRGEKINYSLLFESLIKCQNLENLFIIERSVNFFSHDLGAPAEFINGLKKLITKSQKLYHLYICISVSNTMRLTLYRKLQKLKQDLNKNYISIEIYDNKASYMGSSYDPYINVYDLEPIKHL